MDLTLTAISDPDSSREVSSILHKFRQFLLPRLQKIEKNSTSADFLIFVSVVNEKNFGEFGKNRRGYSAKENAVRVTKKIDYTTWQAADYFGKIDLFATCILGVFLETNKNRLPEEYRGQLIEAIVTTSEEIKSQFVQK